jgi:hypothetical protein
MAAMPWSPGFAAARTAAGARRRPVTRGHPGAPHPRHRHAQAHHAQLTLAGIAPMIAKTFISAKTFHSHSANFFRHNKSLRDLGDAPSCRM